MQPEITNCGSAPRFSLFNCVLPRYGVGQQEHLPVLVDNNSGLPPRLALRWSMRSRRNVVGEKTLADDLRAAALLYCFLQDILKMPDPDEYLAGGVMLSPADLEKLIDYLRMGGGGGSVRSLSTTGQLAGKLEEFLYWIADPLNRGSSRPVAPEQLAVYRERLAQHFAPLKGEALRGDRIQPLTDEDDKFLERLIGPERDAAGRVLVPLRFRRDNPWEEKTQLRNWIAYRLGRELGLRRGEIGKIRCDDVRQVAGGTAIAVRRRPNDASDPRTGLNRLRVKSVERELPISPLLTTALRQYLHTQLKDGGRRGAATPYLIVTAAGHPISGTSLDKVWDAVTRRMTRRLSWHVLRHTWAEETASDLLGKTQSADAQDICVAKLRALGGWTPNSNTPFRYIENAMKKLAADYLRERNARFDEPQRRKSKC